MMLETTTSPLQTFTASQPEETCSTESGRPSSRHTKQERVHWLGRELNAPPPDATSALVAARLEAYYHGARRADGWLPVALACLERAASSPGKKDNANKKGTTM